MVAQNDLTVKNGVFWWSLGAAREMVKKFYLKRLLTKMSYGQIKWVILVMRGLHWRSDCSEHARWRGTPVMKFGGPPEYWLRRDPRCEVRFGALLWNWRSKFIYFWKSFQGLWARNLPTKTQQRCWNFIAVTITPISLICGSNKIKPLRWYFWKILAKESEEFPNLIIN